MKARRRLDAQLKAKVALEALPLQGEPTASGSPAKKQLLECAAAVFSGGSGDATLPLPAHGGGAALHGRWGNPQVGATPQ
jgi:hypothetical protein